MAFISPQLQIDQQQQDRANANYKAIGDSIIGSINGMAENRQRALAEKRQKDQTSLALSQAGANSAEINDYQSTGNLNPILERHSKTAEASRLRAASDYEIDRRLKESNITKNLRAPIDKNAAKGTVAEQSVDRNFGNTYDDFIVGGGYAKVDRGLKSLKEVSSKLGTNGPNLTGGLIGRMPDFVNTMTGNGDAVEIRDQVGSIIQDNLKSILGASYTENEGNKVIERSYNPKLSEAANKKKLDGLIGQMETAAKAKIDASKYFEQHGTMRGFKGTQINSVDDIFKDPEQSQTNEQTQPAKSSGKKPWEKY